MTTQTTIRTPAGTTPATPMRHAPALRRLDLDSLGHTLAAGGIDAAPGGLAILIAQGAASGDARTRLLAEIADDASSSEIARLRAVGRLLSSVTRAH